MGALAASTVGAQDKNYTELAARIVNSSAQIKPGEVVMVAGGKHNIALMEELAIQVAKAGGLVIMTMDSDRFQRALYTEVPERYLEQPPNCFVGWLKHISVFIGLPGVEDPKQ